MILAAGFGTRLGELSRQLPKPLLPVCNRPLIRWAAALLTKSGIADIAVNLHHMGDLIVSELEDGGALDARISYSPEREILGTGGGIKAMAALLPRATIVAVNGKIVADVDLEAALRFHRERHSLATMIVASSPNARAWGAIGVDAEGRVRRLLDEPRPGDGSSLPIEDYLFTGIHLLEPDFIDSIPDGPCCVVRTAYSELFRRTDAPLHAYVHRGYFYEHSTPARYLQGSFNLLRAPGRTEALAPGPLRGAHPSARLEQGARVVEPALVGPRARIASGATVGPEVVLGADARVCGGAVVQRSVVWEGTTIRDDTELAIATPAGVVKVADLDDPTASPR